MADLPNKAEIEDQWSHAVSYAKRARGIVLGRKISLKSNAHSYVIKAHWSRWIGILLLFALVLIHLLPLLMHYLGPWRTDHSFRIGLFGAAFSLFWAYFAYRVSIAIGKIVFSKESPEIHITYGTIFQSYHVVIPSEHVSLKTYMFKADKSDVRAKYGNTLLSLINQNRSESDSELILAEAKSEAKIHAVFKELSVHLNQDTDDDSSAAGMEGTYYSLVDSPPDEWQKLADRSQSKRPFLNGEIVSIFNKLIVKESPEHALIKTNKPWIVCLFMFAVGIGFISMFVVLSIQEQEFRILLSLVGLGLSIFCFVPAYRTLASTNRIQLKHWNNTISLQYGLYPFAKEISFSKGSLHVSLYVCDIERANKVKKPGQTVLSILRRSRDDSELVLSASDTESQAISAFEKLREFMGEYSQNELTEDVSLSNGKKTSISKTSLSGSFIEGKKRKYCVISDKIVAFKLNWVHIGLFGFGFAMGLALTIGFMRDQSDLKMSQRIFSMICAIGVGGPMMLTGVGFFFYSLLRRCIVANKESGALSYSPSAYGRSKGKIIVRLSEIEAIQLCSVCAKVQKGNSFSDATLYEINIITNQDDNRRIAITGSEKGDQIASDANAFAEFLGVPLLDHTAT